MPNPKDYIDHEHEYVRGYVRRKQATRGVVGPRRRLLWYWHFVIGFGVTAVIALIVTRNPVILIGVLVTVSVASYVVN